MFTPQTTIESEKKTEVTLDAAVEEAVAIWEKIKDLDTREFVKQYNPDITLSPVQIQHVLNRTKLNLEKQSFGSYLIRLINRSTAAGHKDFTLQSTEKIRSTGGIKIPGTLILYGEFGDAIRGNIQDIINYAHCGDYFGSFTNENEPILQEKWKLRTVTNYGTCTDYFGYDSSYAKFTNYGTIQKRAFAHSYNIEFVNFGTVQEIEPLGALRNNPPTDSLFSTIHPEEYTAWCETLHRSNKIQLIDKNQTVLKSYCKQTIEEQEEASKKAYANRSLVQKIIDYVKEI